MARPQDPPRGFFPFGNPFKNLSSSKNTVLSSKLLSLLNNFESKLTVSIKNLVPKEKSEILTVSWMQKAMESLCEMHNGIKTLITDLELPVSDWEDKWVDVYLDISVKLLDLCNAFSSELTRINQGHLLLQFALHNLETKTNISKAKSSLDSWKQHIEAKKNPRIESCGSILASLVQTLNLPKVKSSAKGKVLMRALYGVKVQTLYVSGVFASAFSGSSKNLLYLTVSNELPWSGAFVEMQNAINGEIKNVFLSDGLTVLKELEAVDFEIRKLYPGIEQGTFDSTVSVQPLKDSVTELSNGLDLVSKEVDCFFKILLSGRDTLLENLRSIGGASTVLATSPGKAAGKNYRRF